MTTVLLAIDFKTKVCRRYMRHNVRLHTTDEFQVETEITADKVAAMLADPASSEDKFPMPEVTL